jgi:hypothetical protein
VSATAQGGRRRLDTPAAPAYDLPTRQPRLRPELGRWAYVAVVSLWVVSTLVAATAVVEVGAPTWVERPAAAVLLVVLATVLTHRVGGHLRIWVSLAAVLAIAGAVLERNVTITAAAGVTAVLATVSSVLLTRPARTLGQVVREYAVAIVVALSGTIGVAAWNAPAGYQRFNLLVLGTSLALAIAVVWSLGAGLHGMSRQGVTVLVGVAVLLIVLLAYSSFVRTHGSETVVDAFTSTVTWLRETVGGVPRPVEVLIGLPALVVGTSVRSRHREGWWVLVFAVIGTGVMTTSLVDPNAYPSYVGLSTLYSIVLGLGVGLVARRIALRDRSARRNRAIERPTRVEPPRHAALR